MDISLHPHLDFIVGALTAGGGLRDLPSQISTPCGPGMERRALREFLCLTDRGVELGWELDQHTYNPEGNSQNKRERQMLRAGLWRGH